MHTTTTPSTGLKTLSGAGSHHPTSVYYKGGEGGCRVFTRALLHSMCADVRALHTDVVINAFLGLPMLRICCTSWRTTSGHRLSGVAKLMQTPR